MKGLNSLIRLHRRHLDEKHVRLTALERERDTLARRAADLADEIAAESRTAAASFESRHGFAAYAARMRSQRDQVSAEIASIDARLAQMNGEIAEAFLALKRYEISRDARLTRLRRVEGGRERTQLDEIGAGQHRRAHSGLKPSRSR